MRSLRPALLAACLLIVLAPAAPAAAADPGTDFLAEPAAGSSTEPHGGYFVLATTPGTSVTQAIALRNDSDRPLELRLAGVDAATAQRGGSSFALETDTPADAGAWLNLERTSVSLPARGSLTVPFRVTVPAGASSGTHLAGIAVMSPAPPPDSSGASGGQAGASVRVQSRRVIGVQVNLPGPAAPEIVITGVAPVARPDGLYLEMGIENRGGGMTKGEGEITLPSDGFARLFSIDTFVPGTSITYPVRWTEKALDGDHPTHVEVRYGERVATWDGSLKVGDAVKQEQANRQVGLPSPGGTSSRFPFLPVGAGIIGAIVLLAGVFALGRRSRETKPDPW